MGQPAVVMNDAIMATCATHVIPSPAGPPMPGPPMPFNAPLLVGLTTTVLVGGKPAAVAGSQGMNTPPHVGLHPADLFLTPTAQIGRVVIGSATVLFEGKPAAFSGCQTSVCFGVPGMVQGSAVSVQVGP